MMQVILDWRFNIQGLGVRFGNKSLSYLRNMNEGGRIVVEIKGQESRNVKLQFGGVGRSEGEKR